MEFLSGPSPTLFALAENRDEYDRETDRIRRRGPTHLVDQARTIPGHRHDVLLDHRQSKLNGLVDLGVPGEFVPVPGNVPCNTYNYNYHHDRFRFPRGETLSDIQTPGGYSHQGIPQIGCRGGLVHYYKTFGGDFTNLPSSQCDMEKVFRFYVTQCIKMADSWIAAGNPEQASDWRREANEFARLASLTGCAEEKARAKAAQMAKAIANAVPSVNTKMLDKSTLSFVNRAIGSRKSLLAVSALDLAAKQKKTFPGLVDDSVKSPGTQLPGVESLTPFLNFRPKGSGTERRDFSNILPGGPDVVPDAKDVFPGSKIPEALQPEQVTQATKKEKDNTTLYIVLGLGVAAVIGFSMFGKGSK